jgi:hypothetical protein
MEGLESQTVKGFMEKVSVKPANKLCEEIKILINKHKKYILHYKVKAKQKERVRSQGL